MICKKCKKNVNVEDVSYCNTCQSVYCKECADKQGVCDCCDDIKYYN